MTFKIRWRSSFVRSTGLCQRLEK